MLSGTQRKYGLIGGLWGRGVFGARLYLPRVSERGNPRLFRDVWSGFAVIIFKSFSTIIRNPHSDNFSLSHFQAGMHVWHQLRSVTRRDWLLIRLLVRVRAVRDISYISLLLSLVSPQCGCPPHSSHVACVPGCGRAWVCWELHSAVEFGIFLWTVRRWGGAAVTALSSDVQG